MRSRLGIGFKGADARCDFVSGVCVSGGVSLRGWSHRQATSSFLLAWRVEETGKRQGDRTGGVWVGVQPQST
jgi:hypothetical protein